MKRFKNIYLILGRSGSGKDSIVNELCNRAGASKLLSYTTRPQRKNEKFSHTFISNKYMDDILNSGAVIAFTEFDGNRYCATIDQLLDSDFYIIDPAGLDYFKTSEFKDRVPSDTKMYSIGIEASAEDCQIRMASRGDSKTNILRRTTHDFNAFAGLKDKVDVVFYNDDFEGCVSDIMEFIQQKEN